MVRKAALLLSGGLTLVVVMAFIPPAIYSSANGKHRILMAGRSTMDQWFKSWNWPFLIHQHAIWRKWPIPFERYAKGRYYFDLVEVPTPKFTDDAESNGRNMFDAVAAQADPTKYDAVFFKFCFIDFDAREMTSDLREKKLRQMTTLVERVHGLTRERGMKLVLGTALPVQKPAAEAIRLRRDFTDWVQAYGRSRPDVAVVDLYGPLVDAEGRMRPEFARREFDDHVNWRGFRQLDSGLFSSLDGLFKNSTSSR